MNATYEVIVIGGGAAGLSGALTLGRARRKVLVIDAGSPRNAPADGVHNFLTSEGRPPKELLEIGRAEAAAYGAAFVPGVVAAAERLDGGRFRVTLQDGAAYEADRLLVATGLVDELPDVPGLRELWGVDVLHCPYCHGWEVRDQPIGVLAVGPQAVHQALMWRQWSDDVTLFLHTAPEPGEEAREQLAARGVTVVEGEVAGLTLADDRLRGVRLADGREIPRRALVVASRLTARTQPLFGLGLEVSEQEMGGQAIGARVATGPMGATSVPGVYAAGNVTDVQEQVIGAAAAGVRAAAAINGDLIAQETAAAVAALRAARAHERLEEGRPSSEAPEKGRAAERSEEGPVPEAEDPVSEAEAWDARYRESGWIWSGRPNPMLVREVADLPPGRALDLGSGEGGDAMWLAGRGWRVTAADISNVALERAAARAAEAGLADRVDWQQHDLGASFPEGAYDLVSAFFLHSWGDMPREKILRNAAAAVAPGGVLLIVGHVAGRPEEHGHGHGHPATLLPTPHEVLASLDLPMNEWDVLRCEEYERTPETANGDLGHRKDNILELRRHP
ncbi:Thioredoxin reductase [Nonomuraea maritima]|uniref:Thioredoxin reductase n=1 Tax=Nonomuraea maritima TaxID=683260 RepID=A0A1G9DHE6_9ACTN|nr:FAD-dependent oxidoreductase [Nonomuraea maritima]SDK63312.1 Thioredoxin reductase [Nonomuraea maritima]